MWICKCGLRVGGAGNVCPGSLKGNSKIVGEEHYQISPVTPDWIMAVQAAKGMEMNPDEELYAKFYSKGRVLVAAMSDIELHEHIDVVQKITAEAKATLQSALDERRDRNANKTQKEWLISSDKGIQTNVSDAINVVAKRKARMTQMEKLTEQLRAAGLDEATIKEMTRNLEAKATDSKLKTVVFKAPATELKAVQIQAKEEPANAEPKQVFDASKLKFG